MPSTSILTSSPDLPDDAIEVVEAGLLSYEHAGTLVDAVHTRNALHQLPDAFKAIALHRIARLLRPGGPPTPRPGLRHHS